ncbi:MAG: hypothetical protein IEMM0006_1196 [bacterium]|nr:MAG: hypothetical protein IEMM0006_1196 [bacterium]
MYIYHLIIFLHNLDMHGKQITIRIKRVYGAPEEADGHRILVDRLWARGVSKEKAKINLWVKEIAPSTELRHWYGHNPAKWTGFKTRYFAELEANPGKVEDILAEVEAGVVTFLYSAKDERLNNAVALKEYIESKIKVAAGLVRTPAADSDVIINLKKKEEKWKS